MLSTLLLRRFYLCTVFLCLATVHPVSAADEFRKTLTLQGITFKLTSSNRGSLNTLSIEPQGLSIDNRHLTHEIDGVVTDAEVADLNVDGSPELYVYISSAGSGSYGSLVAYSSNSNKSLSEIYLPDLLEDKNTSAGYQGHDQFSVVENRLGRRFPIYQSGDISSAPTGGVRQLFYRLEPGEAGWQLILDGMSEYR